MHQDLRWNVCNRDMGSGKKRHNLIYVKGNKRLLTGFVLRMRKGLPWTAFLVNGPYDLRIKVGQHESCKLWLQRVAEYHIHNSSIAELE